jgi:hypothetical protein
MGLGGGVRLLRLGTCMMALGLALSGCGEVEARSPAHTFKIRSKKVRNEVKVLRPGELGPALEGYDDEKLRYVAYRSLEAQRDRLRSGRNSWTPIDIVALTETTRRDQQATYEPLRAVALEHHIWSLLEGLEPGKMVELMDGPHADVVASWIQNFQRPGRPNIEGRLNRHDFAALQRHAMENMPDTRGLLRWTFEQDQRPGQIAGFLGRNWTDEQLVEIMRMWCNSEGWTPLAHAGDLTPRERNAVKVVLERLKKNQDPLVRREAARWKDWFTARLPNLASLR